VRVTVKSQISVGDEGFLLSFARPWDFKPGQLTAITLSTGIAPRSYSICSSPASPLCEILYTVVESGVLTPQLSLLRHGDSMDVSEPFGSFCDHAGNSVWIANGTGVAPFLSTLRQNIKDSKTLIQGSRTWSGLFYPEELAGYSGLEWVPCLSGGTHPGAFSGRLTAYIKEQNWDPERKYFLCGSAGMVSEVRDILIGKGVPLEKIVGEIYF